MPSRHRADPEEDDDLSEEAEAKEKAEDRPAHPAHRSSPARRGKKKGPAEGVAPWDPDADARAAGTDWLGRPKRPVYWRARDSLWFEPLVALMIVLILIVGLYAYTQNWPPLYVVESDSMQHGSSDTVGLINTGDLVLAQKIDPGQITPYVVGMQTGYSTYGEYGDVILYHPDGVPGTTPVIHRAIVYLQYDPLTAAWSIPSLSGLSCTGSDPAFTMSGPGIGSCSISEVNARATLTLYHIGWQDAHVVIPLGQMGSASGFVTMGDNNVQPGSPALGEPDQTYGISGLVQPAWVVGVARGMIPWFGSIKLLLEGQTSMVPSQSWELMGVTIAGVLIAALGLHMALRRHEAPEDDGPEEEAAGVAAWFRHLFGGGTDEAELGDDDGERPGKKFTPVSKEKLLARHRGAAGGRPRPKVRRSAHRTRPPTEPSTEEL